MKLKLLISILFVFIFHFSQAQTSIKQIIEKYKNVEDIQINTDNQTQKDSTGNIYNIIVNDISLSKDDDSPRKFRKLARDLDKFVLSKKYKVVSVNKDDNNLTQIFRSDEGSEMIVYEKSEDDISLISMNVDGLPKNKSFPFKINGKQL